MPTTSFRFIASVVVILVCVSLLPAGDVPFTVSSPLLALPEAERQQQVEARVAATALTWPGGPMTAEQAVALLSASGNATTLIDAADATKVANLPPFSGDYWQGVLAVCTAFGLTIEMGEVIVNAGAHYEYDEHAPVLASGGPVQLRSSAGAPQRSLYFACGAALVEVSTFDVNQRQGAITWNHASNRRTLE
jgi:hypothetical protein